jgi:hypothetical protein
MRSSMVVGLLPPDTARSPCLLMEMTLSSLVPVHVDDGLAITNSIPLYSWFITELSKELEVVDLGPVSHVPRDSHSTRPLSSKDLPFSKIIRYRSTRHLEHDKLSPFAEFPFVTNSMNFHLPLLIRSLISVTTT